MLSKTPVRITLQLLFVVFLASNLLAQNSFTFNPDTVKSQRFDTGKMWTFDDPPIQYLNETYKFNPDEDWFEDVRLSALRIPGCTASFVSEDGLIMTNHHCAEGVAKRVQKEGEAIGENSFYAETLEDERKIDRYYADQLVLIEDVTDQVLEAVNAAETQEEKITAKEEIIKELKDSYAEETDLVCQVVSLYNGGKFSIYGYKRYTDVRLVFIPEERIGYFGGDPDNFTYPRYNLDCSFMRIYDDEGNPVKANNFFKFSDNGAKNDEVIFTVGNPGSTSRLKTVAQLEYNRDISYRNYSFLLDELYASYTKLINENPERAEELIKLRDRLSNSQKSITNTYKGLVNPYLIARKKDFENKLKSKITETPELNDKYGHIWDAIEGTRNEMRKIGPQISAYSVNRFFSPTVLFTAKKVIKLAKQLDMEEDDRDPEYTSEKIDSTINAIFPSKYDELLQLPKLEVFLKYIKLNLGEENEFVKKFYNGKSVKEAMTNLLATSPLTNKERLIEFAKSDSEDILNSEDPFVYFMNNTKEDAKEISAKAEEISQTEDVLVNLLGQAMYEVYGTTNPPDANFTLRLSDGILKSFPYNGTVAPLRTTFFGLYDRYYSFEMKYPFVLPEKWLSPSEGFDMTTPFNMTSTNDIVGGNSGSAVINQNAEVVGLAFDGNIKSLIGSFIYLPHENRCVSVTSEGMLEALEYIYNAKGLVKELKTGKRD